MNGASSERVLHAIAFPRLDDPQIQSLERCAGVERRRCRDGERLFQAGDRDFGFFVVLSGEVAIVDESNDPPRTLFIHHRGEFTGDVAHLTGRASVVSAAARGDVEVCGVSADGLREIMNRFPALGDLILQAFIARRQLLLESGSFVGVRVIGSRYSQSTYCIRDFLSRNHVNFTWLDLESDPEVKQLLDQLGIRESETPVVAWGRRLLLRNPSLRELAEALGLRPSLDRTTYDLAVVGAGPAGLAAAVYAASEGLSTIVLEQSAHGGQAGTSARIENYLGFPIGISGSELTERAVLQAGKFGAVLPVATCVTGLSFENAYSILRLEGGETISAKCLLIATGAVYRRLTDAGCEPFEGRGVYYAATRNEAQMCRDATVVVVGGGNSAGQGAVFLASLARKVVLVIRHADLRRDMSSYLAKRIEDTPNIEVLPNTAVRRMHGDEVLAGVEVENLETRERRTIQTPALFSFIGASPRTEWLPSEIERDEKGFLRTGLDLAQSSGWRGSRRQPFLLETSRPGVFAAGDVRAGSVKRVASAVGEGAMTVQFVHEYLKKM
jgi:thioredoxin reductase (NADPH)